MSDIYLEQPPATTDPETKEYLARMFLQISTALRNARTYTDNTPIFSASMSVNQLVTNSLWTVANFDNVVIDSHNFYDNTTYRFQPTIAGYYSVVVGFRGYAVGLTRIITSIRRNGANYIFTNEATTTAYNGYAFRAASALLYFNGTTDYVEPMGFVSGTSGLRFDITGGPRFSAHLVKRDVV